MRWDSKGDRGKAIRLTDYTNFLQLPQLLQVTKEEVLSDESLVDFFLGLLGLIIVACIKPADR